jgi:hypothetical protein
MVQGGLRQSGEGSCSGVPKREEIEKSEDHTKVPW